MAYRYGRGHWAPIGNPLQLEKSPYWLSQDPANVNRINVGTAPDVRHFPDYLDKGRKVDNNYVNNTVGQYPNYVKMSGVTSAQTADGVYKDDDYSLFGYTSDNLAETNYEYYYRNFLYRIVDYLCKLKTSGTIGLQTWEDTLTNKKIKEKLLFFQFGEGSTGDLKPWGDGTAVFDESPTTPVQMDLADDIDLETEWPIFVRKHWGWLANTLFKLNGSATAAPASRPLPNVRLMLNASSATKVWGKRSDGSNPGLNNLPRKVTIDFTQPSPEAYMLWPISSQTPFNNGVYNNNADRLTRNWFGRRYNGSSWSNTPDAIMKYLHQSWRKPPEGGHLYNMNFGRQYRDMYRRMKYDQLGSIAKATMGSNNGVIRYRDECDWNNNDLANYREEKDNNQNVIKAYEPDKLRSRPRHLFATATSSLDFGLDYWIQYIDMLIYEDQAGLQFLDEANAKVFTFFNQHVQDYDYSNNDITKSPMSSYLAFKDGLDAADTTRFAAEDLAIHNGNNNQKQKVNSTNDAGTVNGNYNGEKYAEKIATNRNLGTSNIYNQNTLQSVSDIAQGGTGNQYLSNGAGKNDVGWFVTTDNDAAIIRSGSTTKLTMQEVDTAGSATAYKEKQIGYYNIIGKTITGNTEITDKLSPFGRFSKGVVSIDMADNASGVFYQKANNIYIRLDSSFKDIIRNQPGTQTYIAITWFGSRVYNGGKDTTGSGILFGVLGTGQISGDELNRFDISNPDTTARRRWFTKVFTTCFWTPAPNSSPWDFVISNTSVDPSTNTTIQVAMVEVFIGDKPDYFTDNSADTKSYYAYPPPGGAANSDPFADANITTLKFSTACYPWCYPNCGVEEQSSSAGSNGEGDPVQAKPTGVDWQLYPNPATNHTSIKINKAYKSVTITIQDLSGKTLHTQTAGATSTGQVIAINKLPVVKGVYIVTLEADGAVSHKKLVVE